VGGWPLAVSAMKPTGGKMHVHENVNDMDIDNWTKNTCVLFENMFLNINKPMKVSCIHIEKVKSYAPHVLHIVADLICIKI
jgi:tRNA wybutosine-synthesizing protein 3